MLFNSFAFKSSSFNFNQSTIFFHYTLFNQYHNTFLQSSCSTSQLSSFQLFQFHSNFTSQTLCQTWINSLLHGVSFDVCLSIFFNINILVVSCCESYHVWFINQSRHVLTFFNLLQSLFQSTWFIIKNTLFFNS